MPDTDSHPAAATAQVREAEMTAGTDRSAVEELTAYIDVHSDRQCRELMEGAKTEARELLIKARSSVNDRVRRAIRAERKQLEQGIQDIESQTRASVRRATQQAMQNRLQEALPALQFRLRELWQDEGARDAWAAAALDLARDSLPDKPWRIHHPGTFDASHLEGALPGNALCQANPDMAAGLVIECEGARVDASVDGLTRRKDYVCGLLAGEVVGQPPPQSISVTDGETSDG